MPRFGLDIGRGGVKLIGLDKTGAVTGAERALDAALTGAERRTAVVAALREVAAELGVRARDEVAVAVPRAEAIVKCLTLPRVPEPELDRLVRFQAQKDLPFELNDVVLAWGRGGEAEAGGDEVVVAAVRKDAVDEARALLRDAGLKPGAIEVSTQAAARALVHLAGDVEEALLVEVGRATTDIIVLDRGRLAFSRSASVGCGANPEAERAWLDRLSQEVGRTLVAARGTRPTPRTGPPGAAFVAGGGAALPALADALEQRIGARPQVLDALSPGGAPERARAGLAGVPEDRPSHDPPSREAGERSRRTHHTDSDPARGARFVVARGLVAPATPGLPCLDLADTTRVRDALQARRKLVAGAAALGLCLVGGVVGLEVAGRQRAAEVQRLTAEKQALEPRVKKARALQKELGVARRWEDRRGRELEVLLLLSRALPEDDAFLTSLRWMDERPLSLAGRARDWDEVARFIAALEKDPLIARARPEGIRNPDENKKGVEFTATAELRSPTGGAK